MGNDRLADLFINWQQDNRNIRGHPIKRWGDNLKEGLIGRYGLIKIDAENREKWKKRMKEAFG